ncbi:MAG: 5-(carboxyamino)imidazole ribonucleotide mutase [Clostridiaceae bacterium]|nr:5-(carboxyamino)imidazole ribonucleotide mutase [Clostridiaceae bacterium]
MKVAIIMGSSSDYEIAQKAFPLLEKFNIPYFVRVISAHRALEMLQECVSEFEQENVKCVIALAGKAAHLPGVVAGMTVLPVIGVPIKGSAFLGLDSLMSIVQMPKGVPVATVAVDAADNAAILAAQILAINSNDITQKLKVYKQELAEHVVQQDKEINTI